MSGNVELRTSTGVERRANRQETRKDPGLGDAESPNGGDEFRDGEARG